MTRRVSRSGRAYTVGSHKSWGDYPRECAAGCGRPLRITKDNVWQEARDGGLTLLSWHIECRIAASAG
jgi:hypothetical protein